MMSRRTFLGCGSAVAFAAGGPTPTADPGRVLDAHVHFYDPTRAQGVPWPSKNETVLYKPTYPQRYLANIKPFRVDGVVAVEASPWLEDNLWLLEVADRSRLVWGVVGNIQPGIPGFKDALGRFSKNRLFRGVRINASSVSAIVAQPEAVSDLKLLAAKDLSLDILLDGPRRFAEIARLASMLPDLRLVLGHLPLDPPSDEAGRTAYRDDLRTLGRAPTVYAKVSGVARRIGNQVPADAGFYKPALDEIWQAFGPDRVIYASNWPVCDLTAPYATVFRIVRDYLADKDQETVERYFWKNSQAAYKWRPREGGGTTR
jgi:predicted TIM-barrel fold metal-dependent hydrolase